MISPVCASSGTLKGVRPWTAILAVGAVALAISCGRLNYDPLASIDAGSASDDAASDDAAPTCPTPTDPTPGCMPGSCFYIAATGGSDGDTGASADAAWETFDYAWTQLAPGQTLVLLDGVYASSLAPTISGSAGAPITIRAANDGGAIIDGQGVRNPCSLVGVSHLIVDGIQCRNLDTAESNSGTLTVDDSDNITIRRTTLYEATDSSWLLFIARSSDVLVEDVAGAGRSEGVFNAYLSTRVVFRRCFGLLPDSSVQSGATVAVIRLTTTHQSIVENCVGFGSDDPGAYSPSGILVSGNSGGADDNRLLGNVLADIRSWAIWIGSANTPMQGTVLEDNVTLDVRYGMFQRADNRLQANRLSFIGTEIGSYALSLMASTSPEPGFEINGSLHDSVFTGPGYGIGINGDTVPTSLDHDYNVLFGPDPAFNGTIASENELIDTTEPLYDPATFGRGAYLFSPPNLASAGQSGGPIGAEVLKRYQDGELTCTPLWPWPMEDRIFDELGVSVTWEAKGGLWATLDDVYQESN